MMRMAMGPAAVRWGLGAAVCSLAVAGAFSITGHARQGRTVADGVYAAAQAERGAALYKAQCVACHGEKLEGTIGPMLAGQDFVGAWGGRSMAELVDKIQKTMPLQAPNTLSREQSIDLAAYMLQASNMKAGGNLAEGQLANTTFPARPTPAVSATSVNVPPVANLAQYMRGVTFPNANIIFNTQVKDPGATKPVNPIPFDYVLWGNTVYYGWQAVDQAALALIETTPLFMMPGRRCENGRPVPIQNKDYQQWTQDLIALSREIYKTVQTRNQDAVAGLSEKLNDACANCHKRYRDVGTAEGGGLGTDRCKS
jgi:mono/diheme cytochrome c family protein